MFSSSQGRTQEFSRGGLKFWEKYFALTKVQATLFTITFMSYMLFQCLHINTFLDQVQPRRLFFFALLPRYRDFVSLLKYDTM